MRPILYLQYRQLINLAKFSLKSPKRLIPAVFVLLWILQMLWVQLMFRGAPRMQPIGLARYLQPEGLWPVAFAVLASITIFSVLRAFSESPIAFSMADIDFLFPSPLNRRLIMCFEFLKLYAKPALFAAVWLFLLMPAMGLRIGSFGESPRYLMGWLGTLAFLIFMTNLSAIISYIATYRPGDRWWLRSVAKGSVWGILALTLAVLVIGYRQTGDPVASLVYAAANPVILALLLPVKWATDVSLHLYLGWTPVYGPEFWGLVALALVSFVLALLRRENTYEPSLATSMRYAAMRSAIRSGGFTRARVEAMKWRQARSKAQGGVPYFGTGAAALFWKNMHLSWRVSGRQYAVVAALVIATLIVLRTILADRFPAQVVQWYVLAGLGYTLWTAPMVMLHGFRADMQRANILRPVPIPAWQVVTVQTLHGTFFLTALTWIAVGATAWLYGLPQGSLLLPLALVAPFVLHDVLCAQLAVSVLYPNWNEPTQRFIGGMLAMTANAVSVLPPFLAGLLLWYLHVNLAAMVAVVAFVALIMSVGGIALGAFAYRRCDPTGE